MVWLETYAALQVTEKEMAEEGEEFEKTYRAIRHIIEEELGIPWESIPVPEGVGAKGGKAEPLPFGSKQKLTPAERHRYTTAKRLLAVLGGMPHKGWGLYGRTIKAKLQDILEDPKKKEKLARKAKSLLRRIGALND